MNAQENPSPFDAGDRVDVYFADVALQTLYYNNGNDFYTIADDSGAGLSTNNLVNLTSSNNNISPLLGVGDAVAYRNAGTEGGVDYDIVVEVIAVTPFAGTVEASDAGNDDVIVSASTVRYAQPNASGNTVSFAMAPNNVFDGGGSGPQYETSFKANFYQNGTYDFVTNTGVAVTVSPALEIQDIDNYVSSGGTDVEEFVTFDVNEFVSFYFSNNTLLDPNVVGDVLEIDSTGGNNEPPIALDEQLTVRFNGESINSFNFSLGSRSSHKGPNFQLKSVEPPSIILASGPIILPGDNDKDGVNDLADLDDDNDGILDTVEISLYDIYGDEDGDGVLNYVDFIDNGGAGDGSTTDYTDANGDFVPDVYDTDLDGIPDHLDTDSDNDGCPDAIEAAGSFIATDLTADDNLANTSTGVDTNGIPTITGSPQGTTADVTTVGPDVDVDGIIDACDPLIDSDADTVPDSADACPGFDDRNDNDNDLVPDACDLDDDNDGILDSNENCTANITLNSSFETVDETNAALPSPFGTAPNQSFLLPQADVPNWSTTATNGLIEIWDTGHNGGDPAPTPSFDNIYHAEIAATDSSSSLYQDIVTEGGEVLTWSIYHRGRRGVDEADVSIGPPAGPSVFQKRMASDNTAWKRFTGTYVVPAGQTVTRFSFTSFSTAATSGAAGNFIDLFTVESCLDSDNDGIADKFDTDSDNDGCFDAVEAAGSFTTTDLTADNNLANTPAGVDANGIPTIAGSPQATTFEVTAAVTSGIIINEVSNGDGGSKEWIELLVIGDPNNPTAPVDLTGWIIDDNNGDFEGSTGGVGITDGYIILGSTFNNVSPGSLIVIYNSGDPDTVLPADDLTDTNGDGVYVIPSNDSSLSGCTTRPTPSDPNYLPCTVTTSNWTRIGLRNGGDAVQVRKPDGSFFHGFSYGDVANLGGALFPNFPISGNPAFNAGTGSGAGATFYFGCGDWEDAGNFTRTTALTDRTPGVANSATNKVFINRITNGTFNYCDFSDSDNCFVATVRTNRHLTYRARKN